MRTNNVQLSVSSSIVSSVLIRFDTTCHILFLLLSMMMGELILELKVYPRNYIWSNRTYIEYRPVCGDEFGDGVGLWSYIVFYKISAAAAAEVATYLNKPMETIHICIGR